MTKTLILETRPVPLTRDEDGTLWVTGTPIPLERVIESHQAGRSPEEIVDAFDSLRLSDVYLIISHYLDHKKEVEQYLHEQDKKAEEIRRMIEKAMPPRPELREELLRRKALIEKGDASTGS